VLLGLTAQEYVLLASAVVPLIVAIVVVIVFWRWAVRDEARHAAEAQARAADPE
jgi:hypothetical protein